MQHAPFPVIDLAATGANILRLRRARGLSVRDLQEYFGFEEPRAIYKWQGGRNLPTVDNLYALGALFGVPLEEILVPLRQGGNEHTTEQRPDGRCSDPFSGAADPRRPVRHFASGVFLPA